MAVWIGAVPGVLFQVRCGIMGRDIFTGRPRQAALVRCRAVRGKMLAGDCSDSDSGQKISTEDAGAAFDMPHACHRRRGWRSVPVDRMKFTV